MSARSTFIFAVTTLCVGAAAAYWFTLERDAREEISHPARMPHAQTLEILSSKRVFFGHQSVGENILQGISDVQRRVGGPEWPALEITTALEIEGPGLYHAKVGHNVDPLSKISAWEDWLVNQGVGNKVDAAILKLCYVDFQKDTAAQPVFDAYTAAVARIQKACPDLVIIHATCPLTTHVRGFKSRFRNLLVGDQYNLNRAAYNRALRDQFGMGHPVFDIALVESTTPGGRRMEHKFRGTTFHSLYPAYTYDSGHLNAEGARRAATAFLESIADALRNRESVPAESSS